MKSVPFGGAQGRDGMSFEQVVAAALEIEAERIGDDLTPKDIETWDSLGHLTLVTAIEKAFSIKLSMKEVQSIDSLGKLRALVQEHAAPP
jgi:acyl carrier protein